MFFEDIQKEAEVWRGRGLERHRRLLDTPQGVHLNIGGRAYLSFLSNDYLGLAKDERLKRALIEGVQNFGAGSGASPLISGHLECHHAAEQAVATFVGQERALMFITGYMANLAVMTSFVGPGDAIFSDALNHASLIDGCRQSRADIHVFRHLDLEHLAILLRKSDARRKVIATDAVFSMDGDVADLGALATLAEEFDALLVIDDAHGFSVRGPGGRGSWAAAGVSSSRVLQIVTLGKGAGLSGAFVIGGQIWIEHLIQHGRTYVYSTSPLPALAAAVPTALRIIEEDEWRREQLLLLQSQIKLGFARLGWSCDALTPIIPLEIGAAQKTMAWAQALNDEGILVAGIRPPTVAEGASRLRISLSAEHSVEDLAQLLACLEGLA